MKIFYYDLMCKTVAELELGHTGPVISVKVTDSYWDAFQKMNVNVCVACYCAVLTVCQSVSAVPVVNAEGKLVGNISSHDIKTIVTGKATFGTMTHAVGEAAFRIHGTHAFTCKPSTTLEEVRTVMLSRCLSSPQVVRLIASAHVHRLYVVDELQRPIGVISLRDIIMRFVKEQEDSTIWKYFSSGRVSTSS
jgi:CBS domain-containing protein